MTDSQVFGMILIGMALIAFAVLVFFRRRAILLYKHGVTTEAVVLDVKKLKGEPARPIGPASIEPMIGYRCYTTRRIRSE